MTKFVSSILSVYLSEHENIVKSEDISEAKKIGQKSKRYKLERRCNQNWDTYINFFKIADDEDPLGVRMKPLVTMLKPVKLMINVRNARKVIMNVESGYVAQDIINDSKKKVFMD